MKDDIRSGFPGLVVSVGRLVFHNFSVFSAAVWRVFPFFWEVRWSSNTLFRFDETFKNSRCTLMRVEKLHFTVIRCTPKVQSSFFLARRKNPTLRLGAFLRLRAGETHCEASR